MDHERFTNYLGMEFVKIRAGNFLMGAPANDVDAEWNERPQIPIQIAADFFLATTAVTALEFTHYLDLPKGEYSTQEPAHAANYLSACDADAFVECVNRHRPSAESGLMYRLPTEAEWEYACRAGTGTRFSHGDDPGYSALGSHAWYADNAWHVGLRSPQLPALKRANPWGLYDMHGNVWEWTSDGWGLYEEILEHGEAVRNKATRVLRGGGWCHDARYLRASDRDHYAADYRHYYTGMRLAFHQQ